MFKKTIIASVVASGAMLGVTAPASAEMSASIAASNFYLWRGQDITNGAAAVSGSIDYAHESGIYAGIWTSSEVARSEYDIYAGWGGEFGPVGVDISFWAYEYPEEEASVSYSDLSEVILGLSFGDASLTLIDGLQSGSYLFAYANYGFADMYSVGIGHDFDMSGDDDEVEEYTYVDFAVAPVDDISFVFSKIVASEGDSKETAEDLIVNVTWSKSFDF